MSRWTQIHSHFSAHVILEAFIIAKYLNLRRWLLYALGHSKREWHYLEPSSRIRILE